MPIANLTHLRGGSILGRRPGQTVIPVGPSPKPARTPGQLRRARAKLEHAASGHAQMAAQHRAAAQTAPPAEAAELLRLAETHDEAVKEFAKKSAALK